MTDKIILLQTGLLIVVLAVLLTNKKPKKLLEKKSDRKIILDSCALIDGRILEITNAGFISSQLIIPDFVLREFQLLADGSDSHKRERARFGLDIVSHLQNSQHGEVKVYKEDTNKDLPTDDRLVMVAKKLSADLCTIDYNLNKVATIEGVRVLNVNELANAVRPVALPGEIRRVKIVQKGSNKNQGVGYADDGSMIVVEDASKFIGKTLDVEVSRYIQTDAGKMLFAKVTKLDNRSKNQNRKQS